MLDHNQRFVNYPTDKFRSELDNMRGTKGSCSSRISQSLFISKRVKHGMEHYTFYCYDNVVLKLTYDPKTQVSWIKKIYDPFDTGASDFSEFLHPFHYRNDFNSFIWEIDDLNGGTCIINNLSMAKYPMYNCTNIVYPGVFDPEWEQTRTRMLQDSRRMHNLLHRYIGVNRQERIYALIKKGVFNLELLTINNNSGFRSALINRLKRSNMQPAIKDALLDKACFTLYGRNEEDLLNPNLPVSNTNLFSAAKKMYRTIGTVVPTEGTPDAHKTRALRCNSLFPLLYCAKVPSAFLIEERRHYKLLTYKELRDILVSISNSEIDLELSDTGVPDTVSVNLEEIDLCL